MANEKFNKNGSGSRTLTRRNFLKTTTAASAAFTIIPGVALGKKLGYQAPSDTLNVALIGSGNQGSGDISSICKAEVTNAPQGMFGMTSKPGTEKLVAVCDVDWGYGPVQGTFAKFPGAKKYKDWRIMFDEMGKSIDAVVVATADHSHANPTATAMTLGKHVYCEKPLTHTIYESRLLTKLANKYDLATQMGNQGSSTDGVRQACAWAWAGEIGEVRKVDVWSSRPIWPQGLDTPTDDTESSQDSGLEPVDSTHAIPCLIIVLIHRGISVDGGTSEQALSATWLVIICILYSKYCNWDTRLKSRANPLP